MKADRRGRERARTTGRTPNKPDRPIRFGLRQQKSSADPLDGKLELLDWKELEFFLKVAAAGSIRGAADSIGCAPNSVRKRLARIEDRLSAAVAVREQRGLRLTEVGERLVGIGQDMMMSRQSAINAPPPDNSRRTVRIAVTEGIGTYWLMPRIVELQTLHPELRVHLNCDMQRADTAEEDFDIAIQLERPSAGSYLCRRVGTLHLMPFAASSYLDQRGVPLSVDDWPKHRLVWQEADQIASELLRFYVGTRDIGELIGIVTNSSTAHFRAVALGGGIGILPTYARALSREIIPLDLSIQLKREIFCVTNPRRESAPLYRDITEWIAACFSGEDYPWFGDAFIHPRDLETRFAQRISLADNRGEVD